jgi:hypothetical protein
MHELGHLLGYGHQDDGVMQGELSPGTLWSLAELDSIWDDDFDFAA